MYRITIIFLIAVLAVVHPAILSRDSPLNNRIVGGEPVNITDYPYQVAVYFQTTYRCGGVIMTPRWVLTAAQCIGWIEDPTIFRVRAGSSYKDWPIREGQMVDSQSMKIHPNFDLRTFDYDIALLGLKEEIVYGVGAANIKYHGQEDKVPPGEMLRVSGWGLSFDITADPFALRAVSVPKVDQDECKKLLAGSYTVTDQMICAGYEEGGRDACVGDTGGPLVDREGVLVGIVSWGRGCAEPNAPGVYSRVASCSQWISETIAELPELPPTRK